MSNEPKNQHKDVDYSFEPVPGKARKGFLPMFFIMLGFTFFSASMSVGAKLGNGLDLGGFVWAVLIGGLILAAYTGALGYIGSESGLSFDLLARRSFGRFGSYLPSAMISLTQIGWFGVGVAMFAIPAAEVLHVNPILLVILGGVCMTASAYFGIKGMEIISYISVPLIAILGIYSMIAATRQGGGLNAIFAQNAGSLTLFSGVGLVIGSFVSGGTATPNFTRFSRTNKIAVITTVIAFFIGNTLMFAFGAVGGAFTEMDDIFYVMILPSPPSSSWAPTSGPPTTTPSTPADWAWLTSPACASAPWSSSAASSAPWPPSGSTTTSSAGSTSSTPPCPPSAPSSSWTTS